MQIGESFNGLNRIWAEYVAFKKGFFIKKLYLEIYPEKLIFRKNDKPGAPTELEIRKEQIISIDAPEVSLGEYLLKGLKYFSLTYKEGLDQKEIYFWRGMGNFINTPKTIEMVLKLSSTYNLPFDQSKLNNLSGMNNSTWAYYGSIIFGYFWAGVPGILIFGLASFIATQTAKVKSLNPIIKGILIGVYYFIAIITSTIISVILTQVLLG